MIYDCQSDGQVKSKVVESAAGLAQQGFFVVLGLQDLYPMDLSELNLLKAGLSSGIPDVGMRIEMHVAVAEVEAWFLQEGRHFEEIDPRLTCAHLKAEFGFDPDADSAERVPHPAGMLKSVYNSVNVGYKKRRAEVLRTVGALDIENLCAGCQHLIPSFMDFSSAIDSFLSGRA
ncbi:hypothetical protein D3C71_1470560 [compost metagenome]